MISYEKLVKDLKEFTNIHVPKLLDQYVEYALISLLEDNKEYKELWESSKDAGEFQKMLRVAGTENGSGVDMAVWNLIHYSQVFWDVVNEKDIFDISF